MSLKLTIPQHYFNLHHKQYEQQPKLEEMGAVTNWFKRAVPKKRSIAELFEAAANGQWKLLNITLFCKTECVVFFKICFVYFFHKVY